ncbi:hypothetical protein [Citrobacter portucalensis]|uniref:Uncharacterized protein n=1 Tax=Citrobacter portucalensis TaxID=1639133 RepID=A0AAJ1JWK3_9ENTR|nr:hypothetical protein [Citrobacter portucalensis]EHA3710734.1 hypothetical protein [Citrobacter freundii]EJD6668298.1 hypothetical protein [Citrobacter freundii]MBQ0207047.1 hypothetical protein [Citrobacter freundii]MDE9625253.1 hypothetical protein [Citrobacter portucalensis]
MQRFVSAIRKSVQDKNWLAAVFIALNMPDICSVVQNPYAKVVGERYRQWFDRYLKDKYKVGLTKFTAEDCYQFRCKCLHQGILMRDNDEKFNLTPPVHNMHIHLNEVNGVIQLQVDVFCEDMCQAVEQWINDMSPYPAVTLRMKELIEIKFPLGLFN